MALITAEHLDDASFQRITALVHQHFGIALGEQKRALVAGRLGSVLRERQFADFPSYLAALEADRSGTLLSELANRMSTNHTHFWREPKHFEVFRDDVIPWIQSVAPDRDLRLWCAAAATGEEPWTLALLMRHALGKSYAQWKAGLIATDISEPALRTAMRGVYDEDRVSPLPHDLQRLGFETLAGGKLRIRDAIRSDVRYRRFNLMSKTLPFKRRFHTVFIRNVMIYFDQATRKELVERLAKQMEPDAWLFLGHAESLGEQPWFRFVQPAVYRRKAE